jgi:hypothetical protein
MPSENFFPAFGSLLPPTHMNYNLTIEKSLYLWSLDGPISPIAFCIANKLCMDLLATDMGKAAWESYGFTMFDFHVLRGVESPWTDARGNCELTDAEYTILGRVGAVTRAKRPPPFVPIPQRMTHRQKIKREVRRISRQIREFLSRQNWPHRSTRMSLTD